MNAFGKRPEPGEAGEASSAPSRVQQLLSHAHDLSSDRRQAERIQIELIVPNPHQPRRYFNQADLENLAASIRERGVAVPLLLRPLEDGRYEIVFGERRYRAAQLAGLAAIPANVRSLSDEEVMYLSLLENLQRENLNRFDEVEAKLNILSFELGMEQADVIQLLNAIRAQPTEREADRLTVAAILRKFGTESVESFTTNGLAVLRLPDYLADAIRRGSLSHTHAVRIAGAPQEHHAVLLQATIDEDLTVNELRERIAGLKPKAKDADQTLSTLKRVTNPRMVKSLDPTRRAKFDALIKQLAALFDQA